MTIGGLLLDLIITLVTAELTGLLAWAAHHLVRWAVRLSHGQTPRAEIRLREQPGNLAECPGGLGELLYALALLLRGIGERLSGRSGAPGWEAASPSQIFSAVIALSAVVDGFGGDIRAQPRGRRRELDRVSARLLTVVGRQAVADDERCAAASAAVTAAVCRMYVDDRNERMAAKLVTAAGPLMDVLGRRHEAVLMLRHEHAAALIALESPVEAESLLSELFGDEVEVFGAGDTRTVRTKKLMYWAMENAGRSAEAEGGLRALSVSQAQDPDADRALRRHIDCKLSWTVGRQGRTREAAEGYDGVAADRSRELSPHHPDTLDARHSKGKMYVWARRGQAARAILEPLLPDMRGIMGARHPYTLETRKYLALARAMSRPRSGRERGRAARQLRRVLRAQIRGHGRDYPDTRDTRHWLAVLADTSETS